MELVVFMAAENSNTKVIVLGSKIGKTKLIINMNQLLFPKARIIVAFLFPPASESVRVAVAYGVVPVHVPR